MRRATDGRWSTALGRFVAAVGASRLVEAFAKAGDPIRRSTVHEWLSGRTTPRPERAMTLVSLSHGRLELGDVFQHRSALRRTRP